MKRLEHKFYEYSCTFREMEELQRDRNELVDRHNSIFDECPQSPFLSEYVEEIEECDQEAEKLRLQIEARAEVLA